MNSKDYAELVCAESFPRGNMREYFEKKTAEVVELSNGDLIAIDKPDIETHFCFGYGCFGDTYEGAAESAAHARTSGDYFMSENLKKVDRVIDDLKDDSMLAYTIRAYINAPKDTKIKDVHTAEEWQKWDVEHRNANNDLIWLSAEDRERITAAYMRLRERFEKRLKAYLKRYGTSKLHVWTYWQDE